MIEELQKRVEELRKAAREAHELGADSNAEFYSGKAEGIEDALVLYSRLEKQHKVFWLG